MTDITRSQFRFLLNSPTRWGDMDSLGHVNNARFFTYDESARLEYFGVLMADDPRFWKEYGLILAHIGCDFIAQLRHPAPLEIGFRIARLGGSSLKTEAGMFVGEQLIAVTRSVIVWFDYSAQKSLAIPADTRQKIRDYEAIPPQE